MQSMGDRIWISICQNIALGFEIKRTDAPRKSRSMEIAMRDLGLKKLIVLYPGTRSYELGDQVHAMPLGDVVSSLGSSQPFANFS